MKQPKSPSTEEWIKKMCNIYAMEYYSAIKKTEIIPFAATWIEMIMLSEVNQIKQISQDTTYIWNLKKLNF